MSEDRLSSSPTATLISGKRLKKFREGRKPGDLSHVVYTLDLDMNVPATVLHLNAEDLLEKNLLLVDVKDFPEDIASTVE